jgi:hypothetical protein
MLDDSGQPIDVGLLILGHSTSNYGDWPGKLAETLNSDPGDGRNYVVFRVIKGGNGGFLWNHASFPPDHLQYDRLKAVNPNQWCQDANEVRWSCRRTLLERALTGTEPAPAECIPAPNNVCAPPVIDSCLWHADGQPFEEVSSDFKICWDRMDVHLALILDTINHAWPIDDYTGDGVVGDQDFIRAAEVPPESLPCGGTSGVVGDWIDWDCDQLLSASDAGHRVYAEWLREFSLELVEGFDVDHVFLSGKAVEMSACPFFPAEPCSNHGLRTPTSTRPFDHYYAPAVWWEYSALEQRFDEEDLDARIHWATPRERTLMWDLSAQCYAEGIAASDWTIPPTVSRPDQIAADDTEIDPISSAFIGCLTVDHIHHNGSGGWMMADVWYSGLRPYLQDIAPLPSTASDPGAGQAPMIVTGYDTAADLVTVEYEPACHAVEHAVHLGPLEAVASYGFDSSTCGLGSSGQAEFNPGLGSRFWVLTGRDGYQEGSAGTDSLGSPRPEPAPLGPCYLPRRPGSCP